jgi:hypothetical protein
VRGIAATALVLSTLPLVVSAASADGGLGVARTVQLKFGWSRSVALSDATGDGRLDALVALHVVDHVELHIFRQEPDGSLTLHGSRRLHGQRMNPAALKTSIATGDVNGDRRRDVAVAVPEGIEIMLMTPSGLGRPTLVPTAGSPNVVEAADLLGDRRAELVFSAGLSGTFVMTSSRSGRRVRRIDRRSLWEIRVADLNSDGRRDVAGTTWRGLNSDPPDIVVLYGSRAGGFRARTWDELKKRKQRLDALAVLDMTGDGRVDLVATSATHGLFTYVLAQGANGRLGRVTTKAFSAAAGLATSDVNCDGLTDLVGMAPYELHVTMPSTLGITGSVQLSNTGVPGPGIGPRALAVGDLNGDHRPDVAIANSEGLAVFYTGPSPALAPSDQHLNSRCGALKLSQLRATPRRPRPGRTLHVSVRVRDAAGRAVRRGTPRCYLRALEGSLSPTRPIEQSLSRGLLSCRWRLPGSTASEVSGALSVESAGGVAHAGFRLNVARTP